VLRSTLDKRGRCYTCWTTDAIGDHGPGTDALYQAIPFFLALNHASRAFGLVLNSTDRSAFDLTATQTNVLRLELAGGELDCYVVAGPEPASVLEQHTALVSRMPLPPRWALGYQQSRYSYYPADDGRASRVRSASGVLAADRTGGLQPPPKTLEVRVHTDADVGLAV
jgi:alpha-glucosidase